MKKLINYLVAFVSSYFSGTIIKPFGRIELNIYLEQKPTKTRKVYIDKNGILNIQFKPYFQDAIPAINFGHKILNSLYEKNLIKKSEIPSQETVYKLMEDQNHPMGGAPMHNRAEKRVVNTNLELINCPNIFLCSAAGIPLRIALKPTMTVLALANRLAEEILKEDN